MNTKYLGLGAVGAVALVLMLPLSVESRVKDTPHNINGSNGVAVRNAEVCLPCHTPHNADETVGYLWNHELSTATYTLHEGADAASFEHSTRLCLSCHDGTVALDSYGGLTGTRFISGSGNLGTNLLTSHPVGVDYPAPGTRGFNDADADGNVVDPVETPAGSSAHLEDGKVQCVSCHFAHGSRAAYGMFLRVDNTGSALCMTCHTR